MSADYEGRRSRHGNEAKPAQDRTPFEKPGGGPRKPGGRGRFPIGVLVAVLLGVLIVIAIVLAVIATTSTGPGGNGQTTSMAALAVSFLP